VVVLAKGVVAGEVPKNQQFAHFRMNVIFIRLPGSRP